MIGGATAKLSSVIFVSSFNGCASTSVVPFLPDENQRQVVTRISTAPCVIAGAVTLSRGILVSRNETRCAMAKWKLRKIDAVELLSLQEDGAGNLYWRGRRITATDYAKLSVAALLVGMVSNLTRMILDIGRAANWW
jgi:hypothetical protein